MPEHYRFGMIPAAELVEAHEATLAAPWHDHRHLVLGLVTRGLRRFELRGGEFAARAGEGFVLPPGVAHRCSGLADYRVLVLPVAAGAVVPAAGRIAGRDWRGAFAKAFAGGEMRPLLALALARLGKQPLRAPLPAVVRRGLCALAAPEGPVALTRLAACCGVSPFHLQRLFVHATGLSPRQGQEMRRLRRARALLRGGTGLAEVAALCGFADQSHFTRVFKRLMGMPPGGFRRQMRKPAQFSDGTAGRRAPSSSP